MALIIEDGTGKPDAESYISVVDADAYFAARANSDWTQVADKEAALRKGSDYMLQAYTGRWKGYRTTSVQALDWPRVEVPVEDQFSFYTYIDKNTIPVAIKRANAELALLAASAPLAPNLERAESSVQVGPISVSYDPATPQSPRYPAVDMTLRPYLYGGSTMRRVERT